VTSPAPGSIGWLGLTVEDAPLLRDPAGAPFALRQKGS
jgi:hypothetical protein